MLTEAASGINNNGLITGVGIYDDGPGGLSDGYRAFVLDASSLVSVPSIPGDFNNDGSVDAADYVTWRKTGGPPADYNQWRTNFGRTSDGGSGAAASDDTPAVPEPVTLVILLIGMTVVFSYSRTSVFGSHTRCEVVP